MTYHTVAIGFGRQEPGGPVTFRSEHLQADATNRTDLALIIHRARSGDDIATRQPFAGDLVNQTQRIHHAGGRPADIIDMHGDLRL